MNPLHLLIDKAKSNPKHIVLAEGEDIRVAEAAVRAQQDGLAQITLLGPVDAVRNLTRNAGDANDDVNVLDPQAEIKSNGFADHYHTLRQHKGISLGTAANEAVRSVNFANLMVKTGAANGSIAGAVHSTSDVVRSALQIIGLGADYSLVSSFFIMALQRDHHPVKGGVIFTDCGLVITPTPAELGEIACTAAKSAENLLGLLPKIAMLSFSTYDSAAHQVVENTKAAIKAVKSMNPDLSVDGPLQFDAALMPAIAEKKAPESDVAGQTNVFVFPDLNAGNIAYKIAERIGGATAIGPILQGLNNPANDLSRGCNADDIYGMIAVTVVQAAIEAQNKN